MSHFSVIVMVDENKNVEKKVEALLGPYSENMEVKPYYEQCYCVTRQASDMARELTDEIFGPIEDLRAKFKETHPEIDFKALGEKAAWKKHNEYDKEWAILVKDRIQFNEDKRRELIKDPQFKPDPDCNECKGTGKYESTYNPKSKWDWWQIGGRWTGWLEDIDPREDPNNWETCSICKGTGMRNDKLGKEMREKDPDFKCNACGGKGKQTKFYMESEGNIVPIRSLNKDKIPYAIVTPDGEWHEKGSMGWWGMASCEIEEDNWEEFVKDVYIHYIDYIAVLVDCHI